MTGLITEGLWDHLCACYDNFQVVAHPISLRICVDLRVDLIAFLNGAPLHTLPALHKEAFC